MNSASPSGPGPAPLFGTAAPAAGGQPHQGGAQAPPHPTRAPEFAPPPGLVSAAPSLRQQAVANAIANKPDPFAARRAQQKQAREEDRVTALGDPRPLMTTGKRGWGVTTGRDANAMARDLNQQIRRSKYRKELLRQKEFVKPNKARFNRRIAKPYYLMKNEIDSVMRTLEKRPQSRAQVPRRRKNDPDILVWPKRTYDR